MHILGPVILWVIYFIIGIAIAVPYLFLAGWDTSELPLLAFFSPVTLLVLAIVGIISGAIPSKYFGVSQRLPAVSSTIYFWSLLAYVTLPISANIISKIAAFLGFKEMGAFIFEHRFSSPLFALAWIVVALIITTIVFVIKESLPKKTPSV